MVIHSFLVHRRVPRSPRRPPQEEPNYPSFQPWPSGYTPRPRPSAMPDSECRTRRAEWWPPRPQGAAPETAAAPAASLAATCFTQESHSAGAPSGSRTDARRSAGDDSSDGGGRYYAWSSRFISSLSFSRGPLTAGTVWLCRPSPPPHLNQPYQ